MTGVAALNALPAAEAEAVLRGCCGSAEWVRRMMARRPFGSESAALDSADRIWVSLFPVDWREAFSTNASAHAKDAPEAVQEALDEAHRAYEERFGYVYVVSASGMSALELLDLCRRRLDNDPVAELAVSAEEQRKITRRRMERLFAS